MKRIIPIIAIFLLLCSACGSRGGADLSDAHYNYGVKAVEIADEYLDFSISAEEAHNKIAELSGSKDILPDTEYGDSQHAGNSSIEHDVTMLSHELLMIWTGDGSYDDLLDIRNSLAETVGEKER